MPVPFYDDSTPFPWLPDANGVVDFNGPRICNAVPPAAAPGNIACAPAADFKLVPRSEWEERVKQKNAEHSWLEDIVRGVIASSDQDGLGYCHAYGTKDAGQNQRLIQGHAYVELSAESVGGPITGWRNQGADPADDLEQMVKHGACPASYMDRPHSLNPRLWKAGWEKAALDYRVTEWRDLRASGKVFDACATAALLGMSCASGFLWWSHFISGPYRLVILARGKFALRYRNNWGSGWGDDGFVDFAEGKGTPDWAFATGQMTPTDVVPSDAMEAASEAVFAQHGPLYDRLARGTS